MDNGYILLHKTLMELTQNLNTNLDAFQYGIPSKRWFRASWIFACIHILLWFIFKTDVFCCLINISLWFILLNFADLLLVQEKKDVCIVTSSHEKHLKNKNKMTSQMDNNVSEWQFKGKFGRVRTSPCPIVAKKIF